MAYYYAVNMHLSEQDLSANPVLQKLLSFVEKEQADGRNPNKQDLVRTMVLIGFQDFLENQKGGSNG